jgi:hypothetical protein
MFCLKNNLFYPFMNFFKNNTHEPIKALYPSERWSAVSWTYRLIKDFERSYFMSKLLRLVPRPMREIIFQFLVIKLIDIKSYHKDCSRKIFLFKILNSIEGKKKIVLPECGPAGFEIMVAKAAGFDEIITYDNNQNYIDCFRLIWPDIKCFFSTTANFDFHYYVKQDYIVLIPDWSHDNIERLNIPEKSLVKYSAPDRTSHLNKMNSDDFILFFTYFKNIK